MRLRLAALPFLLLPLVALADAPTVARIQSLKGAATVVDLGRRVEAAEGLALHDGFTVEGGPETRMTILFNDGNVRFVGRNARMTWKAEGTPASVAGNAAAVVGHILSDGSANVFRNVVTGAATGVKAVQDVAAGPAPAPSPAAAPQTAEPAMAPGNESVMDPNFEKTGNVNPAEQGFATEVGAGPQPGEAGAAVLGTRDDHEPQKKLEATSIQKTVSARRREALFRGEAADAWKAGRGFSPCREGALRAGRDGLAAPKLEGATRYAVRLYPFGEAGALFDGPATGDPPALSPETLAPHVKRGAAYEYEFIAYDRNGAAFASARIPFATLGEEDEKSLDAALDGIDGLGTGTGVEARLLLKAMLFSKYGLDALARRHAADAARGADPGVKDAAGDFLRALDGR